MKGHKVSQNIPLPSFITCVFECVLLGAALSRLSASVSKTPLLSGSTWNTRVYFHRTMLCGEEGEKSAPVRVLFLSFEIRSIKIIWMDSEEQCCFPICPTVKRPRGLLWKSAPFVHFWMIEESTFDGNIETRRVFLPPHLYNFWRRFCALFKRATKRYLYRREHEEIPLCALSEWTKLGDVLANALSLLTFPRRSTGISNLIKFRFVAFTLLAACNMY